MSTRANIIIKDAHGEAIFYRHSDGYPTGVKYTLETFIKWLRAGRIRNNVSQAAGWLIILGAAENDTRIEWEPEYCRVKKNTALAAHIPGGDASGMGWKVGAYEPATAISGDIEFLYVIDLVAETLTGWHYKGRRQTEVTKHEWAGEATDNDAY